MKCKKIICLVLSALVVILMTACSFFSKQLSYNFEIKEISSDIDYTTIATQGYMGGALIYNEENKCLGQLVDNVSIAVRLSKADVKDIANQTVFHEIDDSVIYGLLTIDNINKIHIDFSIKLYKEYGLDTDVKSYSIKYGEKLDINNDGLYDLEYGRPYQERFGYENARYLYFLSSQENLNITMFAVIKEQYPNETYPNGIIGVNPDGRFVIQKYTDIDTGARTVVTGVYANDYVMDNKNAVYQRVSTNNYARQARAITDNDLETMEIDKESEFESFYFTEADFAFKDPEDLISALPKEIVEKYQTSRIEKLNNILEDKNLLFIVDVSQGSILSEDYKEEIFEQFDTLTTEDVVQINRCFMEENYKTACPQRLTVSKAIVEVLPLASVVISEEDLYESSGNDKNNSQRAASASWTGAKNKKEYEQLLSKMESKLNEYKATIVDENLHFPMTKQTDKNMFVTTSIGVTNCRLVIKITGSWNSTWTSVSSSVGAIAFFKAQSGVDVSFSRTDEKLDKISESLDYKSDPNSRPIIDEIGSVTNPITKATIPIVSWEKSHTMNIVSFAVGPIVFGINLEVKFGIPVKMNFELDTNITYDAYIAAMAYTGVSASLNWGLESYKKWIFTLYRPYVNGSCNKWAHADAIYYVDFTGESLSANLNRLSADFTVMPFVSCDLYASVAGVLHAGLTFKDEINGYVKFGYYKPKLYGSFGLDNNTNFELYAFIGIKGVKILGISLGDMGKKWSWPPVKETIPIIKETRFFEKEI